ncbi:MAG: hypothetical protein HY778_08975 [Betaproteobacteria bacterium]|nr:hypothetical protein [Betaproteobacteria bacterium]
MIIEPVLQYIEQTLGAPFEREDGTALFRTADANVRIAHRAGQVISIELAPSNPSTMKRFVLDGKWCGTSKRFGDARIQDINDSGSVQVNCCGSANCTQYVRVFSGRSNACGGQLVEVGFVDECDEYYPVTFERPTKMILDAMHQAVEGRENRVYEIVKRERINFVKLSSE